MAEPTAPQPAAQPAGSPKRRAWLVGYLIVVLIIAGGVFFWWWGWLRFEEYTDDAYVAGNMVALTPQVPGIIVSINADETDIVEKNQLIIELDPTDATLSYEQRKAEFAEALRQAVAMFENVSQIRAQIEQSKALLWKSALDYEHRKNLVEPGGVSLEDFEHSEADLRASFARLVDLEHALISALAQVEQTSVVTHPLVKQAQERLKESYILLGRTRIYAPVTGMVAQRNAQVGERIEPGTKLLAIVPLDEIWVYANYKETQLKKVRIGQPVKMTADIYGGSLIFHGEVIGISGGTGSVFSIIPPQNATGNWIKIVQRLPVRITLDPDEIRKNPLRLGLSMEVRVDLHDTGGSYLPRPKNAAPVYQTDIFERELQGVDSVIDEIIKTNVSPFFLENDYYEKLFKSLNGN